MEDAQKIALFKDLFTCLDKSLKLYGCGPLEPLAVEVDGICTFKFGQCDRIASIKKSSTILSTITVIPDIYEKESLHKDGTYVIDGIDNFVSSMPKTACKTIDAMEKEALSGKDIIVQVDPTRFYKTSIRRNGIRIWNAYATAEETAIHIDLLTCKNK